MMFMKGYLKIRISGYSPERFLNLCNHKCIYLWEIRRTNDFYEAYVLIDDFRKIRQIVKKTRTCVRVLEKEGLPFFLYKYRNRKLFFAGIVLAVLLLHILSMYIWQIEISQNYRITDDQILRLLSEHQIEPGIKKSSLNCLHIEKLIRKEFDEVVWASARQDGARLIIMINENDSIAPDEVKSDHKDIYAPYSGRILHMVTRTGTPLVENGSIVNQGDLLVEGLLSIEDDYGILLSRRPVQADADIEFEYSRPYQFSCENRYIKKRYTEKIKSFHNFIVKDYYIQFPQLFLNQFERYDTVREIVVPLRFLQYELPFSIEHIECREYYEMSKSLSEEDAKNKLSNQVIVYCDKLSQSGIVIKSKTMHFNYGKEKSTISGNMILIETIGAAD